MASISKNHTESMTQMGQEILSLQSGLDCKVKELRDYVNEITTTWRRVLR